MRFETLAPFERLRIDYAGKACRLADPLAMRDPRSAFQANPFVPVEVRPRRRAASGRCSAASASGRRAPSPTWSSRAVTTSSTTARAAMSRSTASAHAFDGLGLRDHSWGPRSWQAPLYYRWLTANFGDDFGFMAQLDRRARRRRDARRLPAPRRSWCWCGTSRSRRSGPAARSFHDRLRARSPAPMARCSRSRVACSR